MAPTRIEISTLLWAAAAIAAVEVALPLLPFPAAVPPLLVVGAARVVETAALVAIICRLQPGGLAAVGLVKTTITRGLMRGLIWSGAFGLAAAAAGIALYLAGINPLGLFRSAISSDPKGLVLLLSVGALAAPIAEELFFRGILFGYMRRWGFLPALVLSTILFVGLHPLSGLALPQTVGGIVFAAAYEVEKNLLVPTTIHVLGNAAIFSLSLWS